MLTPVFADVLKQPQNSLVWAKLSKSGSFSPLSSTRSILFSTKRHGSFPPSKKVAASSTDDFHLTVLKLNKMINKTYSSLVWILVASDITTHPWASLANILVTIAFLSWPAKSQSWIR